MMKEIQSQRVLRNRRRRRLRHYLALGILLIALCMTGIIYSAIVVEATQGQEEESPLYKYFTEIRVDRDDTLWSISRKYMGQGYDSIDDLADEIRQINSISFDRIDYGQRLIIPYYSEEWK